MTSQELHTKKIIPLRLELQRLEDEYRELFRKECGEKIGEKAWCGNCAFSCIIETTDHNCCMGGKCTCCNNWCYHWTPENEISKFLRENYHHNSSKFHRLEDLFGYDFLRECNTPKQVSVVMEMLRLIAEFDGKLDEED